MSLAPGTRLGPYEVVEPLGAGGMGEVYKARDGRLGRDVAIKVLPPEVAKDESRLRRFEIEARAASALNHPNILSIYDIGSHGEAPYLVMELLEGQTLTERIAGQAISLSATLDVALQIAHGLAAAHAKGIVHRDLKPDNVFITLDGRVKLLDFGLARNAPSFAAAGQTQLPTREVPHGTEAGSILGTVGYMSPEQARGEAADTRSDIFSFGCVLYEMLGGRRAFARGSAVETLHAILTDDPPGLTGTTAAIPDAARRIVSRCLEKRPNARFASGGELVAALQVLSSASATLDPAPVQPATRSLVVLPFTDLSPGKDSDYFSDGLTEEIIGELSRIASLRVISRTTAMSLKGTSKSVPVIARELGVRYVLEGSVRRAGANLRISTQLVDSSTDMHAWSERFSGTLDDVFDIQERVARAIAEALKVKLTDSEARRIARRPMPSIQVYDCYLKARSAFLSFSASAMQDAERLLLEGLEIAGENPLLLAGLARVHFEHVDAGLEGEEGLVDAETFARKALALDAECAPALLVLGLVEHFRGHLVEAVRLLKAALALDPNDADILWWLTWFASWVTGRPEEAMVTARRLLEVDPANPMSHNAVAWVHFVDGRFDEALAELEEIRSEHPLIAYTRALALASAGRGEEARAMLEPFAPGDHFEAGDYYGLFFKFALNGERHRFPEAMRPEFVRLAELDACTAVFFALFHALAGDSDAALDWLEKAVPRGYFNYPFLRTHARFLEPLRGHPRFERLMEVVKARWEEFGKVLA